MGFEGGRGQRGTRAVGGVCGLTGCAETCRRAFRGVGRKRGRCMLWRGDHGLYEQGGIDIGFCDGETNHTGKIGAGGEIGAVEGLLYRKMAMGVSKGCARGAAERVNGGQAYVIAE